MIRGLLVEDDAALGAGISMALTSADMEFVHCGTIAEARAALDRETFGLHILDVNLPDGNGVELCREIRRTSIAPIILLTVNDRETDIVAGLGSGADDYVTKPFSLAVLRARVEVALRHSRVVDDVIRTGPFSFDFATLTFTRDGDPLELSRTEQRLLRMLVDNEGLVLSRRTIADRIWDEAEDVDDAAVYVVVKRLRAKLEDDPAAPRHIVSVYGVGYRWTGAS